MWTAKSAISLLRVVLQAAQVRKSSFMPAAGVARAHSYHPDTHHYCTVHAGTFVKQVSLAQCSCPAAQGKFARLSGLSKVVCGALDAQGPASLV